jgi:hypothetical protein
MQTMVVYVRLLVWNVSLWVFRYSCQYVVERFYPWEHSLTSIWDVKHFLCFCLGVHRDLFCIVQKIGNKISIILLSFSCVSCHCVSNHSNAPPGFSSKVFYFIIQGVCCFNCNGPPGWTHKFLLFLTTWIYTRRCSVVNNLSWKRQKHWVSKSHCSRHEGHHGCRRDREQWDFWPMLFFFISVPIAQVRAQQCRSAS